MNKKIFIIPVFLVILLAGYFIFNSQRAVDISNNTIENDNINLATNNQSINEITNSESANESNEEDIILNITTESDYGLDMSDPETLKEVSDDIVIAKVESIDGSINYNPGRNRYSNISTIGKLKIEKVLKGNLTVGSIVPFRKTGGEISYSEYEKSLSDAEKSKFNNNLKLSESDKKTKVVTEYLADDIKIEKSKTYLIYMGYDKDYEKYALLGVKYGLREYNVDTDTFKNNVKNTWEKVEVSK